MALVAHWMLNGDLEDSSGNNNHMNSESPLFVNDDKYGKVLKLDGTIARTCISDHGMDRYIKPYTNFSYTLRVRASNTTLNKQCVFGNYTDLEGSHTSGSGGDGRVGFWFLRQSNRWRAVSRVSGSPNSGYLESYPEQNGKWVDISVVIEHENDSYITKFYVNNELADSSVANSTQIMVDSARLRIGNLIYKGLVSEFFEGYVADIRIFNHALSEEEREEIHKSPVVDLDFKDVTRPSTNLINASLINQRGGITIDEQGVTDDGWNYAKLSGTPTGGLGKKGISLFYNQSGFSMDKEHSARIDFYVKGDIGDERIKLAFVTQNMSRVLSETCKYINNTPTTYTWEKINKVDGYLALCLYSEHDSYTLPEGFTVFWRENRLVEGDFATDPLGEEQDVTFMAIENRAKPFTKLLYDYYNTVYTTPEYRKERLAGKYGSAAFLKINSKTDMFNTGYKLRPGMTIVTNISVDELLVNKEQWMLCIPLEPSDGSRNLILDFTTSNELRLYHLGNQTYSGAVEAGKTYNIIITCTEDGKLYGWCNGTKFATFNTFTEVDHNILIGPGVPSNTGERSYVDGKTNILDFKIFPYEFNQTDVDLEVKKSSRRVASFASAFKGNSGVTGLIPRIWENNQEAIGTDAFKGNDNAANFNTVPLGWGGRIEVLDADLNIGSIKEEVTELPTTDILTVTPE